MSLYVDAINGLRDVLKAATVKGQPLDYFNGFWFGEDDIPTDHGFPYMWIHLDNPMMRELWAAARNLRGGEVSPLVDVGVEKPSGEYPYGQTGGTRGILTVVSDVMNVIDNSRATILAASTKLIDMNLDVRNTQPSGQGTWTAQIVVIIKPRFRAGDR
jgi:hypothetical protein